MSLKDELPRLVGAQYATGDQWRNNSRKNEDMEPKQKQHPVVDVTGDGSKVHSLPLLQKRKTIFLNIPNKAPVFITHNLHSDFSKILLLLSYEYLQNLALHPLYLLYVRDSQFVTSDFFAIRHCAEICKGMQVIQR